MILCFIAALPSSTLLVGLPTLLALYPTFGMGRKFVAIVVVGERSICRGPLKGETTGA